jgi:hypothetical protein
MVNENTEHNGEVDVPVEAIQIIDPNVVAGEFFFSLLLSQLHFIQPKEAHLAQNAFNSCLTLH